MSFTKKVRKELLLEIILFLVGVFVIVLFHEDNMLLSLVLIALWAFGIKFWHEHHDVAFFISGAIVGPIAEIICIQYGVWQYKNPSFLGIPIWLPLAWGFVTMLIKRIAETFVKIELKK